MNPTARSGRRRFPPEIDVLLIAAALLAATAASGATRPYSRSIEVTVSAAIDSAGTSRPVVQVGVPYRALVFKRDRDVWRSALRVAVVAERDGRRVGGGVAGEAAEVTSYAATRAGDLLRCRVPVELRGDRPAKLQITASVPGTARSWRREMRFDPGQGVELPWYFADFNWNLPAGLEAPRMLGQGIDTLRAVVDLGRRTGVDPAPVSLQAFVRRRQDRDPEPVAAVDLDAAAEGLTRELALAATDLPFGVCELVLRLDGGGEGPGAVLELGPPRRFVNLGLDWSDARLWKNHVSWLEGIADGGQRDRLRDLPAPERARAWDEFWSGLADDPGYAGPDLREHLMRIVSADERFGDFGRGALSDRGRVYVRYGPPDRIEARGDELSYTAAWEIWYYHSLGLVFSFYDAHGLGDFRLHTRQGY